MSDIDRHDDAQFDALLRDLGPSVPMPELDPHARARLMSTLTIDCAASQYRRAGHFPRWVGTMAAAGAGLAAVLGLICTLLFIRLNSASDQLTTAQWETQEALVLLMKARQMQTPIAVAEDLQDLQSEDLVVLTFDHALCPIARRSTPAFKRLTLEHSDTPVQFLTLDVTGDQRDQAEQLLTKRDIGYALRAPLGAQTGVITVLDTKSRRIVSSAPGDQGLRQAAQILAAIQ